MGQVEGLPCWDFKARHCYHHSTSCGPTSSFNGPKPVSLAHVSVILCPEGITYHHWGRMGALRLYEVKKAKRLINKIILLPSRLKKGRFLSKQKCKHLTFFFLLYILPAFYSKDFIFFISLLLLLLVFVSLFGSFSVVPSSSSPSPQPTAFFC